MNHFQDLSQPEEQEFIHHDEAFTDETVWVLRPILADQSGHH
jgi:hypothetical protein